MNKRMKEFSDKILEAIEDYTKSDETFAWVKPWSTLDCRYRNGFSNHTYRGLHNVLTCAVSGFSDPRYFTFNQVQSKGGKVKKGSKATKIIFWKFIEVKEKKEDGIIEVKKIPYMNNISVFNAEQIENLNLPELEIKLNDDMEQSEIVTNLFNSLGVKSNLDSNKLENSAYYSVSSDSINIPNFKQFKDKQSYVGTALHELVHWTASRVNRNCSNYSFDIEERAFEELVAEIGSMYLCMLFSVDGVMNKENLAYVNSWKNAIKGKNGEQIVYKACKLADKATKYIIENSSYKELMFAEEKENIEEGVQA